MVTVNSLRSAILSTLVFFDTMDRPLTLPEVKRYLYAWDAELPEIDAVLEKMKNVERRGPYYFLKGREQIVQRFRQNASVRANLWKKVSRFQRLFSALPFVRMVGVCNSLAFGSVHAESDIDLFVVTENGRLSSARFFFKMLTQVTGSRVHGNKKAGRFCLSFFVTEDALNLGALSLRFDPYLAYFVRTMVPVVGGEIYDRFVRANASWVRPYGECIARPISGSLASGGFHNWYPQKLENFFERYQHARDHRSLGHSQSLISTPRIFKCNEIDRRLEFAERFERLYGAAMKVK